MAFNFFSISYKPKYSSVRTQAYISHYHQLLELNIRRKLNALYVQPPIASSVNESWSSHQQNNRYISFDNKFTSEVNEIVTDPSNYMRYTLNRFVNTDVSLYTSMICLQRDFKEENGEVMVAHNYFIEYYQMEQTNIAEQIIPLLNNILSIISAINDDLGFKDVEYSRYDKQKLKILSIEELSNKYPTLSLKDALNHYVAANGLTFIRKVYKPLPNGKRLLSGQPTTDNYEESGILYVYNDTTNSVIPIVKIAIRPNQELIKKQIIMDIPVVLQEQIYSNTILNEQLKFPLSLGVQIFFSNLMFINLKKFHLCEVVHSPCSPKLMKYFKDNEIEIM